jgi:hypothetical protein
MDDLAKQVGESGEWALASLDTANLTPGAAAPAQPQIIGECLR